MRELEGIRIRQCLPSGVCSPHASTCVCRGRVTGDGSSSLSRWKSVSVFMGMCLSRTEMRKREDRLPVVASF